MLLDQVVRDRNLGVLIGPKGPIRLWSGRVWIPDVAYFSWDRLPKAGVPEEPITDLVPNLVVQVLCVGNTDVEMRLKRDDYFRAGVELVWEVNPRTRSVDVYTDPDSVTLFTGDDVLTGGLVLPEFRVSLPTLFGELDRHK